MTGFWIRDICVKWSLSLNDYSLNTYYSNLGEWITRGLFVFLLCSWICTRTLYFHEYSLAVQFKSNCELFTYLSIAICISHLHLWKKIHESEIGLIRADFISLIPNVVSLNYGLFYNDVQSMGSRHSLNFVTISCDLAVFKKKIIY